MRRGMPRGRGNRAVPRGSQNMDSGPLITSHFQGLKDIDMELDLLKRKREIIEQQQQILSNNYRQINDFGQLQFNESLDRPYDRPYGTLDDSQQYGGGVGSNRKRHIPVWEHESPPKRFSAPSRGVKKAFGSRLGPPPNNPRPEQPNFQTRPFKRPNPPPQRKKDFFPTKVTKANSGGQLPSLLKFKYQPPAERKKLVDKAANLTKQVAAPNAAPLDDDESWTLRCDREPSRKLNGRLELALGSIMKELKANNPEHERLFTSPGSLRVMKQVVRERIRLAMIGKKVVNTEYVKSVYYDIHPNGSDNDLIRRGLEAQQNIPFIPIDSDDPEIYFKRNMGRLMSLKLEHMLSKMEEVFSVGNPNYIPPRTIKKLKVASLKPKIPEIPNEAQTNIDNDVEIIETGEDATKDKMTNSKDTQNMVEVVEEKQQSLQREGSTFYVTEPTKYEQDVISTANYKVYDKFLSSKMTQLLKKFVPKIIHMADICSTYRKFEAAVREDTKRKILRSSAVGSEKPEKRVFQPLPFFVKIMGKPSLPKRKAMEVFFDNYNPKVIKKHRNIHNLLYVGFADKEPFEQILTANGTVIGRNTLDIMISDRNVKKRPDPADNSVVTIPDDGTDVDGIIAPDLDEQITDLLTTIRKAEEKDFSSDDVVICEPLVAAGDNQDKDKINESTTETKDGDSTEKTTKDDTIEITEDDTTATNNKNATVEINEDDISATNNKNATVEIKEDTLATNKNTIKINDDTTENKENSTNSKENNSVEINENTTQNNTTEDVMKETNKEVNEDVVQIKDVPQSNDPEIAEDKNNTEGNAKTDAAAESEKKDTVGALIADKAEVKLTPTRASARLANPSNIRTRRTSTLQ